MRASGSPNEDEGVAVSGRSGVDADEREPAPV